MSAGSVDLESALSEALAQSLGAVTIDGLVRLSGGASRETWAFAAEPATAESGTTPETARHELILQRSRFAVGNSGTGPKIDEAAVLRHAHAGGVCVSEVIASGTGENPIGAEFIVSRRMPGEAIARRILRDDGFATARARLVDQCARELALIHALDPGPVESSLVAIDDPLALQRATYESFDDPHPVFDLVFRWLDENRPTPRPACIVHGDFRLGNLLVDASGLTAVLDWELCYRGDPLADLGWLVSRAWRFGGPGEVGGIGRREELLAGYLAAGGSEVTLDELRWWEALATLRWGVVCMFMVDGHRRGSSRSIEQATIGRRVVETEYDAILLLRRELAS